jgi:hypothetical protein
MQISNPGSDLARDDRKVPKTGQMPKSVTQRWRLKLDLFFVKPKIQKSALVTF